LLRFVVYFKTLVVSSYYILSHGEDDKH